MKLLTYMATGRPILACRGVAGRLEHDVSAWLLPEAAGAPDLAAALEQLWEDRALRDRLGSGARATLRREHDGPTLAAHTLGLLEQLAARSRPGPGDRRGSAADAR